MTGEVQPVCARCEHTPLEHSAGPCHQRSAAGVGCDCGGWAAAVTLGRQALIQKIRDRVDLQAEAQRRADTDPEDEVAADAADDLLDSISDSAICDVPLLLDEVDRLRALVNDLTILYEDHTGAPPVLRDGSMLEADRD